MGPDPVLGQGPQDPGPDVQRAGRDAVEHQRVPARLRQAALPGAGRRLVRVAGQRGRHEAAGLHDAGRRSPARLRRALRVLGRARADDHVLHDRHRAVGRGAGRDPRPHAAGAAAHGVGALARPGRRRPGRPAGVRGTRPPASTSSCVRSPPWSTRSTTTARSWSSGPSRSPRPRRCSDASRTYRRPPARGGSRSTARADAARALLVLTHGAGGGIDTADLLAIRGAALKAGIAVVAGDPALPGGRAAQPGEPGSSRTPGWLHLLAAVRRRRGFGALPLVVGGRSNGARVACRTALESRRGRGGGAGVPAAPARAAREHPAARARRRRRAGARRPGRPRPVRHAAARPGPRDRRRARRRPLAQARSRRHRRAPSSPSSRPALARRRVRTRPRGRRVAFAARSRSAGLSCTCSPRLPAET